MHYNTVLRISSNI